MFTNLARILCPVFLNFLMAAMATIAAEPRTWTSQDGRTIQATFVRSDDESVVLNLNGKTVSIPLDSLSDEDREYVREQRDGEVNAGSTPGRAESKRILEQMRDWTDIQGNSMRARFIRVHGGDLVLKRGAAAQALPFDKFSVEDQAFVKEHLELAGEDQMLADLEAARLRKIALEEAQRRKAQGLANGGNSSRAPRFPTMPTRTMPKMPEFPSIRIERDHSFGDRMAEHNRKMEEARAKSREAFAEQRRRNQEHMNEVHQRLRENLETLTQLRQQRDLNGEIVYICLSCNEQVAADTRAGDSCPHCHVRFDYVEDEKGNRTYEDGTVRNYRLAVGRTVGGVIGVLGILLSVIGYFAIRNVIA